MVEKDWSKAVADRLEKYKKGPPPMRELAPKESLDVDAATMADDGKVDFKERLMKKLALSLGADPMTVAKTSSGFKDIVERFAFLDASSSQRQSFLQDEKIVEAQAKKLLQG